MAGTFCAAHAYLRCIWVECVHLICRLDLCSHSLSRFTLLPNREGWLLGLGSRRETRLLVRSRGVATGGPDGPRRTLWLAHRTTNPVATHTASNQVVDDLQAWSKCQQSGRGRLVGLEQVQGSKPKNNPTQIVESSHRLAPCLLIPPPAVPQALDRLNADRLDTVTPPV